MGSIRIACNCNKINDGARVYPKHFCGVAILIFGPCRSGFAQADARFDIGFCCLSHAIQSEPHQHPKPTRGRGEPSPLHGACSRLESLPVPCFQSFALVSNRFDSRLEIAGWRQGFVAFGLSTRCGWPTLSPGNMSYSSIRTDSARLIAGSGEPAPRQETANYWILNIAELIKGQWYWKGSTSTSR
jgi:hypothetical protein